MSYFKAFSRTLIRSPLLWGTAIAFCFFALIQGRIITNPTVIRYLVGHWVEYVETWMFGIGLSALFLKWRDVVRQKAVVNEELLEPVPQGGQEPAAAGLLLESLGEDAETEDYLPRRLRESLDLVKRTGTAEGLEDHLKYLSDLDASRAAQSYGLMRFVIWAIPIMGFLGTVIGITEAIACLSPTQLENITGVVSGLGVAFDTTATALALAMVLMFLQYTIDRAEQALLTAVDHSAWTALAGRFQSVEGGDGTALAIARLSEAVTRSSARLIDAQEQSWRSLEQAASGNIESAFAHSGSSLQAALEGSLDATLARWTDSLTQAHDHLTSQREDRWARAADALTSAMQGFERHQRTLAGQTEMLSKVVDATRDVATLERTLEANLSTLTATARLDETLATLAAAIQLLAARTADAATEPRRVELHGSSRLVGKAA